MEKVLSKLDIALAMNEWMRRYIEEPESFSREFEAVNKFLEEETEGIEPSYGEVCSAYMMKLHDELEVR